MHCNRIFFRLFPSLIEWLLYLKCSSWSWMKRNEEALFSEQFMIQSVVSESITCRAVLEECCFRMQLIASEGTYIQMTLFRIYTYNVFQNEFVRLIFYERVIRISWQFVPVFEQSDFWLKVVSCCWPNEQLTLIWQSCFAMLINQLFILISPR